MSSEAVGCKPMNSYSEFNGMYSLRLEVSAYKAIHDKIENMLIYSRHLSLLLCMPHHAHCTEGMSGVSLKIVFSCSMG